MPAEIFDDASDFFEDLYENLFEREKLRNKDKSTLLTRTKHAYHYTERVEGVLKMIFGFSIFISAVIATVWGFSSVGEIVKALVSSWYGRVALSLIGISYFLNGLWRYIHARSS